MGRSLSIPDESPAQRCERNRLRAKAWRENNQERVRLYRAAVKAARKVSRKVHQTECDYRVYLDYVPKPVTLPRLKWLDHYSIA
jgi:hypothetical protein